MTLWFNVKLSIFKLGLSNVLRMKNIITCRYLPDSWCVYSGRDYKPANWRETSQCNSWESGG